MDSYADCPECLKQSGHSTGRGYVFFYWSFGLMGGYVWGLAAGADLGTWPRDVETNCLLILYVTISADTGNLKPFNLPFLNTSAYA